MPASAWLRALRIYLAVIAIGNLVWEALHLPLYTVWSTGTVACLAFTVAHCAGGDLLIALATLTTALLALGHPDWPQVHFRRVAALTIASGLGYAVLTEWLNVVVRQSWAYSTWMPMLPLFGLEIGASPLLQWLAIPAVAFAVTRRATSVRSASFESAHDRAHGRFG